MRIIIALLFILIPALSYAESSGTIINTIITQPSTTITEMKVYYCKLSGDCAEFAKDYYPNSDKFQIPYIGHFYYIIPYIRIKDHEDLIHLYYCKNIDLIRANAKYATFRISLEPAPSCSVTNSVP